jgi:hypothetical protein
VSRLCALLGIDARAFLALLAASVRMDLRSQHYRTATRAGGNLLFTPLFWVVAQNLFVSLVLALVLVGRTDVFGYALGTLTAAGFLLACSLVVEFHEVVSNPDDADIVAALPVGPRTYAAVRAANLLLYVALLGGSLALPPAVVGLRLPTAGAGFLPAYLLAAALACLATTGAVIGLYLLLAHVLGGRRLKDVLAFAQAGFTLVALYGIQLLGRTPLVPDTPSALPLPAWVAWTPPGWFAELVEAAAGEARPAHLGQLALSLAAIAALSGYAYWRLTREYARVYEGTPAAPSVAARDLTAGPGRLIRAVAQSREEAAGMWVCATLLRRDPDVRLRILPALGAAPGFFLIGWLGGQVADPFRQGEGADPALALVLPYLLALAIPLAAHQLTFSRDFAAAWVFHTAPVAGPAVFIAGLRKFLLLALALPLMLFLFAGFAWAWGDPVHAAVHAFLGFVLCAAAGHLAVIGVVRDWPFSRRYVRGEMSGRIAVFLGCLLGAATAVGAAQSYAYRSAGGVAAFTGVLLAATWLLGRWARRVARLKLEA